MTYFKDVVYQWQFNVSDSLDDGSCTVSLNVNHDGQYIVQLFWPDEYAHRLRGRGQTYDEAVGAMRTFWANLGSVLRSMDDIMAKESGHES